eukprot:TRINITY_DN43820_c0_g1_i1.p1 TRINITY_DN43820_c0_g1~~TRINITY_DN43820_c0_g1_i1.p1  ORF type:complete len:329 (+),score=60.12 TRINITY_DN43820_c0_g1_i1:74-1060(+)
MVDSYAASLEGLRSWLDAAASELAGRLDRIEGVMVLLQTRLSKTRFAHPAVVARRRHCVGPGNVVAGCVAPARRRPPTTNVKAPGSASPVIKAAGAPFGSDTSASAEIAAAAVQDGASSSSCTVSVSKAPTAPASFAPASADAAATGYEGRLNRDGVAAVGCVTSLSTCRREAVVVGDAIAVSSSMGSVVTCGKTDDSTILMKSPAGPGLRVGRRSRGNFEGMPGLKIVGKEATNRTEVAQPTLADVLAAEDTAAPGSIGKCMLRAPQARLSLPTIGKATARCVLVVGGLAEFENPTHQTLYNVAFRSVLAICASGCVLSSSSSNLAI